MDIFDQELIAQLRQSSEKEFLEKTFGTTEQYMQVMDVIKDIDGLPLVKRVQQSENGYYAAYYPIKNEPFYYTHFFTKDLVLSGDYIEPANRAYLTVVSEKMDLAEILSFTTMLPTDTWQMGKPYPGKAGQNGRLYKNSGFYLEPDTNSAGEFETKIMSLLDQLSPYKNELLTIGQHCDTFIRCYWQSYVNNTMIGGWCMGKEMINKLSALGLAIDFDLYCSGTPFN